MAVVIAASTLAMAIQALNFAFSLYERVRATKAGKDLPDWNKISTKNAILQGKINAEKERLGIK